MRPRRQDANHGTVRDAFRAIGFSWVDLHELGKGRPDGMVGFGGICALVEIKDPAKPPSKRKLTEDQREWWLQWTGGVWLVETSADVERVAKWLRRARDAIIAAGVSREDSGAHVNVNAVPEQAWLETASGIIKKGLSMEPPVEPFADEPFEDFKRRDSRARAC